MMLRRLMISGAISALVAICPGAMAQSVQLRIADFLPDTHFLVQQGIKPWMDEIAAASQGRLSFQHFPSQQLGKATDILRLTETNVAQIGVTGVSFASDKMELSDVVQLAGMFDKSCSAVAAYSQIAKSGSIATTDFDKNGVKLLFPIVLPPFQLFSRSRPVNTIDDIRGMKVFVSMRSGEMLLNQLGAVPIRLSSGPMAYEGMQRGTVDAVVFPADSVLSYDMQSLTKFGTLDANFGGQLLVVVMNKQAWEKLDQPTRDLVAEVSDKAAQRVCSYVDDANGKALAKLIAAGDKLLKFSDDSQSRMQQVSASVADAWAKSLDDNGKPGTGTLNAFRAAVGK